MQIYKARKVTLEKCPRAHTGMGQMRSYNQMASFWGTNGTFCNTEILIKQEE